MKTQTRPLAEAHREDGLTDGQRRRAAELEALDWHREGEPLGTIKMVSPSGRLAVWLYPTHNHYQEIR